jgi:hypothetical protein
MMNNMTDLDKVRKATALGTWTLECKKRMQDRHWLRIDFDSDQWPLRSLYKTKIEDINLAPTLKDFGGKDPAYATALRCLMAEAALKGDVKKASPISEAWRLMSKSGHAAACAEAGPPDCLRGADGKKSERTRLLGFNNSVKPCSHIKAD